MLRPGGGHGEVVAVFRLEGGLLGWIVEQVGAIDVAGRIGVVGQAPDIALVLRGERRQRRRDVVDHDLDVLEHRRALRVGEDARQRRGRRLVEHERRVVVDANLAFRHDLRVGLIVVRLRHLQRHARPTERDGRGLHRRLQRVQSVEIHRRRLRVHREQQADRGNETRERGRELHRDLKNASSASRSSGESCFVWPIFQSDFTRSWRKVA